MKRKTLLLRVPKDIVKRRKRPLAETCDYLEKYQRPVNRRRVDPVVVLSNAFESILNEMRDLPDSDPFHYPVNAKVWSFFQPLVFSSSRQLVSVFYYSFFGLGITSLLQ